MSFRGRREVVPIGGGGATAILGLPSALGAAERDEETRRRGGCVDTSIPYRQYRRGQEI